VDNNHSKSHQRHGGKSTTQRLRINMIQTPSSIDPHQSIICAVCINPLTHSSQDREMRTSQTPAAEEQPIPSLDIPEIIATSRNGTKTLITPLSDDATFMTGSTLTEIPCLRKAGNRAGTAYEINKLVSYSPIRDEDEKLLSSQHSLENKTHTETVIGSKGMPIENAVAEQSHSENFHEKNDTENSSLETQNIATGAAQPNTPASPVVSLFSPPSPSPSIPSTPSDSYSESKFSDASSAPWDWGLSPKYRDELGLWDDMLANEAQAAEMVRAVYGEELEKLGLVRDREVVEWHVGKEKGQAEESVVWEMN
jgi:hypothetical protein